MNRYCVITAIIAAALSVDAESIELEDRGLAIRIDERSGAITSITNRLAGAAYGCSGHAGG